MTSPTVSKISQTKAASNLIQDVIYGVVVAAATVAAVVAVLLLTVKGKKNKENKMVQRHYYGDANLRLLKKV
jgi:hypothetical protein